MDKCTLVYPVLGETIFLAKKKRKVGAGFYNGFGGKKRSFDEPISITACREFAEESGIKSGFVMDKVAILDFFQDGKHILECHVWFIRAWTGDFLETAEMGKAEQFPFSNLPYAEMMTGDRFWLPLVVEGEKIRAKIYYDAELKRVLKFEHGPLTL